MKAAICTRYGPPEVLQLQDVRDPVPGAKDVLIRIRATTVTPSDCYIRSMIPSAPLAKRLMAQDRRYFATYYAIDAVNFRPADMSSALDKLDAAYLPIAIQDAAGVPLDPSFAEQKSDARPVLYQFCFDKLFIHLN